MDLAVFDDLIDRFGASPAAWPMPARDDALRLLAESDAARGAQSELGLVEAIWRAEMQGASAAPAQIASRAMRHRQQRSAVSPARKAAWLAAAVAALLLGVAVGQIGVHIETSDQVVAIGDMGTAIDVD